MRVSKTNAQQVYDAAVVVVYRARVEHDRLDLPYEAEKLASRFAASGISADQILAYLALISAEGSFA
jgi:hypothetical protein